MYEEWTIVNRMMFLAASFSAALAVGILPQPASAAAADPADLLSEFIEARVPQDWGVRVRWRDDVLVAFVSPPVAEAFDLFYDSDKQLALLRDLCPPEGEAVWQALRTGQDIAVEPVVMGKGGVRASCHDLLADEERPAS